LRREAGSERELIVSNGLAKPKKACKSENNVFGQWQPRYKTIGIATFPVINKKPCVKKYNKLGLNGSTALRSKFHDANALGFMCGPKSGVTIIDVDSSDAADLEKAVQLFGRAVVVWRTGSGNYAVAYRYNGEPRLIRPFQGVPIDVLGDGYAVLPPSLGAKGVYTFIRGNISDLANLSPMSAEGRARIEDARKRIPLGTRNNTLFKALLRHAPRCDDFDSLLDVARTLNMDCNPPLPDSEVIEAAKSAWGYEVEGKNWVGRRARATTDKEELDLLKKTPYGFMLLMRLRISHPMPDAQFAIDQIKAAEGLCCSRETLRNAIRALMDANKLKMVHKQRNREPHQYILTP
jgi:hypothetical protein